MPDRTLCGCHILIVEDEFLLANDLQAELSDAEAVVLGPVGTLEEALDLVRFAERIDGAILDINLGGEAAYPVADLLIQRGVPFVFTSGYDGTSFPPRFAAVTRCGKPTTISLITQAIGRAIHV